MATATTKPKTRFDFEGVKADGSIVKGALDCYNKKRAQLRLLNRGIKLVKISRQIAWGFGQPAIKPSDINYFFRQMATLIAAGVPILQALEIIRRSSEHGGLKVMINKICKAVEGGATFAEALDTHKRHVDEITVWMVWIAENAGLLDKTLQDISIAREKMASFKKRVKKALTYPLVSLGAEVIVLGIMLVFVVPKLQSFYESNAAELPMLTQVVVDLSNGMIDYGHLLFMAGVVTFFGVRWLFKNVSIIPKLFDRMLLKMPVLGPFLALDAATRTMSIVASQLRSAVPLNEALKGAAGASGNSVFDAALRTMQSQVTTGIKLSVAMTSSALFPQMLIQMVETGEHTGQLDLMLLRAVDYYSEQLDNQLDMVTAAMDAVVMSTLSITMGVVVVAMYLPIFKMASVI